jgi:hypothetical protein
MEQIPKSKQIQMGTNFKSEFCKWKNFKIGANFKLEQNSNHKKIKSEQI